MNELCVNRQMLLDLAPHARLMVNPPGQIPPGALSGERASRQQGRGLNFDSLRRYQPGDDIRMIDWQTTARLRTPWVRQYNEERERPVFLLVDQRLDMHFATRGQTKASAAAKTAALLAWRSHHDGDRLGSLVFNDTTLALHPCRAPRSTLPALLDDLTHYNQLLAQQYPLEPERTQTLSQALQRAVSTIPRGAWVAILSDFHDLDAQAKAMLAHLRRRCEVSAFVLFDDLHLRLPRSGTLAACYGGRSASVTLTSALSADIRQHIIGRLARQQQQLNQLGIRVNHLTVTQDLLRQLQKGL
ncbi:DUF58 domain-containing protein [Klebsiella aerogenes]|jgi:uncharacterized protein (DUF58 family)|uniref:DUF58 domain-containing protein n=1 Tax=Klebsiella TaxID=570 RepID=UPI00065231F3|nr:DUF58 domain-containing protein [Klebsiella aerogenes]EIV2481059.1 DUF58 domain-containing protein [Klebsiella aerogenes]EJL5444738.1 DUF58 domain-containing protein [Klebsiella aerogenes]EKY1834466.1 DUF58 domain-containing protein [Klebsiella aerogenes]EKZ3167307.1 DUF58 domain-containing protein [Klebsiella aerogenes]EKZ6402091.1 DUF58 domain-containing protein [Klebsiella aerogenes]